MTDIVERLVEMTDIVTRIAQWAENDMRAEGVALDAKYEIERLREENEKLLRNAKQDAEMMMAYNRICQKHGFAPSSSDLISALQQKETE